MSRIARKQEQLAFVRDRILEATVAICVKKGIDRATMADIAAAAGYSAPTLYQYFKSKEDILIALLERTHRMICGPINVDDARALGLGRAMSFAERIELLMRQQMASVVDRPEVGMLFAAIEMGAGMNQSPRLMKARQAGMDRFHDALTEYMRRACEDSPGDAPDRDPEMLAMLYHAVGRTVFAREMQKHGGLREEYIDAMVAAMVDLFLHGAMGGARSRGGKRR